MQEQERYQGCLLGLACGDAIGAAVEGEIRGKFPRVSDMIGGGPFGLAPGQWTDDTSMALCLATSLVEKQGFDARDQMQRYCAWRHYGYLSATGRCFDIGTTVGDALRRFQKTGDPFSGPEHADSAGNGCIMRLAPIALFFFPDRAATIHHAAESSRTTHGAEECLDACRLLASVLHRALAGDPKQAVLLRHEFPGGLTESIQALARGDYRQKPESEICTSGYVVECLEAALWCFLHTDNFQDAVLRAVNLGRDADTVGAVCGQVAGAYYGVGGIPSGWLEKLCMREPIRTLANSLWHLRTRYQPRDETPGP